MEEMETPLFKKIKLENFEIEKSVSIQSFELEPVSNQTLEYEDIKKKYGLLANHDPDQKEKNQKNRLFHLNPSVKEALQLEKEEERLLNKKVQERLNLIEKEERERAATVGYQEGYAKGYADVKAEWVEKGFEKMKKLETLVEAFEQVRFEVYKTQELFLMKILQSLVKKIILKELQTDTQYIARLAEVLVKRVGLKKNFKIQIHPQDEEMLNFFQTQLFQKNQGFEQVSVEVSTELPPQSCRVQTEWNTLEASLEDQMNAICSVFEP